MIGLRQITVADAQTHSAGEDAESARWRDSGTGSIQTVTTHFQRCVAEWEADGPSKTFAVVTTEDGVLVGTLDIQIAQDYLAVGQANVAYGIYPQFRRRGLAARAVVLACRYIAAHDLADEAVLRIDPANKASVAVAHRVGFAYHHSTNDPDEGTLDWFIQAV
ncbi:GNAT family N-acetyltransferase [Nocardia cyriacigeorgica]|uniref:GNAT family N-acetyltransferase n=1 Tax=Nocardia cyriacigeorgica TaxID=135487 RepID=A0A6P1D6G8_9NOCA|nr:GNAT family N-acetyltransferase [Nocardia cyriacigeorgica]NEW45658.1 GNAT family N-acetyltransferase [Nocardia cyriacigeorgica]NEW51389.1 GNAT family N-acetyltransferase [Nocardia cyriacigeorgica]NEW55375.1 GNAT family N-acetyltransferase [Nocardia cyriacigeorgica]